MEIRPADSDGEPEGGTGGIPRVNPSDVSAARAAEFGSVANDSGKPGESRSERAKRAWETRRANGNAPAAKLATDARKPASAKTRTPLNVNSIEFALTGIHALLAASLATPELDLKDGEAKIIAENIVAVARHYDLQASEKATDWGNLVVSLGIVYGGRVVAIMSRTNAEAKVKRGHGNPILATQPAAPASPASVRPSPEKVTIHHPTAAGLPNGAAPLTRPRTPQDDAFLNELEPAMF